jgi:hypothetical protein
MKTRTSKQEIARLLRMKKYSGCHGQSSYHGNHEVSIQLFREKKCIYDISYKCEQWGKGSIIIES